VAVSAGQVDLHTHSTRSDGACAPAEVARAARAAGLAAFALTDHDTVDGLAEAEAGAAAAGIEFVAGVEVSAYDERCGSVHVLGYCVRADDPGLRATLEGFRIRRAERAREIVARLNRLGVALAFEEVEARAAGAAIGRPHVARALLDGGWVASWEEAFGRYLGAGRPAYVPTRHATPEEAVAAIRAAGGVAVLAHPGARTPDEAIRRWRDRGLDGLEVWHPDHDPERVRHLRRLAGRLDLLATGGSDWHGWPHEAPLGSQKVGYEALTALRARAAAGPR
jgi:predicted metal-dependent phosphoesterase TrpH